MMQKHHKETSYPRHTEHIVAVTGMYLQSNPKALWICVYTYIHTQSLFIGFPPTFCYVSFYFSFVTWLFFKNYFFYIHKLHYIYI